MMDMKVAVDVDRIFVRVTTAAAAGAASHNAFFGRQLRSSVCYNPVHGGGKEDRERTKEGSTEGRKGVFENEREGVGRRGNEG